MTYVDYARVSSLGQSLDVQLDKLEHCDKIFKEKRSGASGQLEMIKNIEENSELATIRLGKILT